MSLPRRVKVRLVAFLRSVANQGQLATEREARDLLAICERSGWAGTKRTAPRKREVEVDRKRRQDARAAKREETSDIRAGVMCRALSRCEVCGSNIGCTMDHFVSGSGRRLAEQAVENCWWLCGKCHGARQANRPSAAHWNEMFRIHAERHGYPVIQHIEHLAVVSSDKVTA